MSNDGRDVCKGCFCGGCGTGQSECKPTIICEQNIVLVIVYLSLYHIK